MKTRDEIKCSGRVSIFCFPHEVKINYYYEVMTIQWLMEIFCLL